MVEAIRFNALLSAVREAVPEVDDWWADRSRENKGPLTLAELSWLVPFHVFDEAGVPTGDTGLWARLFRILEALLLLEEVLWADEQSNDDAAEVDAFAGAGMMCDVTRTRASLEALLPWMGPACVASARIEVAAHSTSRGFSVEEVDWTDAGTRFVPLTLNPTDLAPLGYGA